MTQPLSYGVAGDRPYALYYKHSNRVSFVGVVLGGLGGLVAGLLAAVIYAYLTLYIPLIYINLACVCVFGYMLGFAPARNMAWGKVRSVPVVLAMGTVIVLLSYYFHWVVWLFALVHRADSASDVELMWLAAHPIAVARVIGEVYDHGTWGLAMGTPMSGPPLAAVWLVEAGIIFSIAIMVAKRSQSELPYCETCDAWCKAGVKLRRLKIGNPQELKRRMQAKDWDYFNQVGPSAAGASTWFAILHHHCGTCDRLHTLTATAFSVVKNSNGTSSVKERIIVNKLLVEPGDVDIVRGFSLSGPVDPSVKTDNAAAALSEMNQEPPAPDEA